MKNFMTGTSAHELVPSEWLSNIPNLFRESDADARATFLGALQELLVVNQMVADLKELSKSLKDTFELNFCAPLATILHFINFLFMFAALAFSVVLVKAQELIKHN